MHALITALAFSMTVSGWGQTQNTPPVNPVEHAVELPPASADDGPVYPVSRFVLRYVNRAHPEVPPRERVMNLQVTLGQTASGYVAPRDGVPTVKRRLSDLEVADAASYHASGLQTILEAIRDFFARQDFLGIDVVPDPEQIDRDGNDLRPANRTALRIAVTVAIVADVRTIASGERIRADESINHPAHRRIAANSPSRPYVSGDEQRRDVVRRESLDLYLARLSRHPGRRVDAAVSSSGESGSFVLDYLVAESDPLLFYSQLSNTGTDQTDRLRARFGLIHSQLTNHDDVLSLDYITSFNRVNGLVGSYELPFPNLQSVRGKVSGSWNEYTASDVGIQSDTFSGEAWWVQGEINWNFFHHDGIYGDLLFGVKYESNRVVNELVSLTGDQDFMLPHLGVRFEQRTDWYAWTATLLGEWNVNRPDPIETSRLGRLSPDLNFAVLRWDFGGSFFLEPLIDREGWADPNSPESSTLAHEIAASFRGQYALENRLVPQQQLVAGGLYTVRGYPQSVAAGDSGFVANLEYRFHLPRVLAPQPEPGRLFGQPFRFAPDRIYGQADWDLILKGFVDVGQTLVTDKVFFENASTLVGAGLGLEFQYQRRFNVRLDWGSALHGIDAGDVHAGSNRFYFSATWYF